MNIAAWILVGFFVLGGLTTVLNIGKKRDVVTPPVAAAVVFVDIILVVLVFLAAGIE